MPKRTISRRALRDQNDAAENVAEDEEPDDTDDEDAPKAKKARTRKAAVAKEKKPAKPRKKAVKVPQRMFARWAVCDNGLKRVAVFEYNDRAGADAKLAETRERKAGTFFILLVKDPYDPPAEPAVTVA